MDDFQKLSRRAWFYLFLIFMVENAVLAAGWLAISRYVPRAWQLVTLLGAEIILIVISLVISRLTVSWLLSPLKMLWQAVLFLSPNGPAGTTDADKLRFGRELVVNVTNQIYQLASVAKSSPKANHAKLDFIINNLPLPLLVIDEADNLKFVNAAAGQYLDKNPTEMLGGNLYDALDMSFANADTFETWLKQVRSGAAVATKKWNRVKLSLNEGKAKHQFDLVTYYNKSNPQHFETILVLVDQTERYSSEDDQASFVALAVHELRNPLTMLRGYIEVLEEEVDDKTNLELTTDLQKMRASAKLLTEYTNNILNVSRVDSDQLSLHLRSEDWAELVKSVVESMRLRARVHGLEIKLELADKLPPAGVDRVSASEIITNLIDNAIKYSGQKHPIVVSARLNQAGEIETTVQDFGVVIDPAVIGNLFQRFYRNHQSRSQVTGTGLGLYLCKALVEAHGGNIWISSSAEKGTIAGFTVQPYSKLAEAQKAGGADDIVRVPHGWIKNHSLYRR